MKSRNLVIVIAMSLVIATVIWMVTDRSQSIHPTEPLAQTPPTPLPGPQATPVATVTATQTPPMPLAGSQAIPSTMSATQFASSLPDVMPKGSYQGMKEPGWPIYWKKREHDRDFEWKSPIEFYGKVVDQNEQPIPGVEVSMNWTDMSPKGTSDAMETTDADGKFSMTGIQGKNFGVRSLRKDGYVEARSSNPHNLNMLDFGSQRITNLIGITR